MEQECINYSTMHCLSIANLLILEHAIPLLLRICMAEITMIVRQSSLLEREHIHVHAHIN